MEVIVEVSLLLVVGDRPGEVVVISVEGVVVVVVISGRLFVVVTAVIDVLLGKDRFVV
jgi:hypothetical protein